MSVLLSTITRQTLATSHKGAQYCSKYLCSRHLSTFVLSILLHAGRHSAEKEFSSQDVVPAAIVKRCSSHRQALYCCHKEPGLLISRSHSSAYLLPCVHQRFIHSLEGSCAMSHAEGFGPKFNLEYCAAHFPRCLIVLCRRVLTGSTT